MISPPLKLRYLVPALLLALPSTLRAELPPPGTDPAPGAAGLLLSVEGVGEDFVRLFNMAPDATMVMRGMPTSSGPGMEIPTELVAFDLSGVSPVLGRVHLGVSMRAASRGAIRTPGPGMEAPSDSFFDIFTDIQLPDHGLTLTNLDPLRIGAMIDSIPLRQVHVSGAGTGVALHDASGSPLGKISHAAIDFNPFIHCLPTRAAMRWTLPEGLEGVELSGKSTLLHSGAFTPPGGLPEINTEILAMDLTGISQLRGPLQFMERRETYSPGRSKQIDPVFADSFFDVFFEIHDGRGVLYMNDDPLVERARISSMPPVGVPYNSAGPVKLLDGPGGSTVAVLESFTWIWEQPGPCCEDADGDGVAAPPCDNDCDDKDPRNWPGNIEYCTDGGDNDCDLRPDCLDPDCQGRICNDLNACTEPDVCREGACVGLPRDCDDTNDCTADRCDPETGACQHAPVPAGAPCDDRNLCTGHDVCDGQGGCTGDPLFCDDENRCTLDRCDPATGQCVHADVSCDDGNACTLDRCDPATGECVQVDVICEDENPCTRDFCDPQSGECRYVPLLNGPCDDGNLCTRPDFCGVNEAGGGIVCVGVPVDCDDGNPCTREFCDPQTGECQREVLPPGTACDDLNPCTQEDSCNKQAVCLGKPNLCDDGNLCTLDQCNPFTGECGHREISCDDGNACTLDRCDPLTGQCVHAPVGPPGPVGPTRFTSLDTFEWAPSPDAAIYNAYRGGIPQLGGMRAAAPGPYTHTCFESGDAQGNGPTVSMDADPMLPGEVRYYDETGETVCGEGPLGRASNGTPRPNPFPCPTPPP